MQSFDRPLLVGTGGANVDATLASLAFINVTWETNRASYLDNFVPYALEALRVRGSLNDTQVAEFVAERFGLDFPTNVVQSLLQRGVRSKSIVRDGRDFRLAPGTEDQLPDLVAKQQEHKREQVHLVRGLVAYAEKTFGLNWSDDQAEEALVAYVDFQAVPLLTASQRGGPIALPDATGQNSGYVVARFVASIIEGDPVAFGYLDGMIKGSMLASVLFINTTGQVSRRFRRTTLYLDTPVCLRVLGHEGDDAKNAARQMLGLARAQGAELACFDHNVREMRGVLEGARTALRRSRGSQTAVRGVTAHFRATGATPADVDLAIARLEQDLADLRIQVQAPPDYSTNYSVDEPLLEDVLQRRVGYREESTRIPDVKSLTGVHRLREGVSGPHLETCRAVLITNNSSLVRASREFFNSGQHEWPLAMVDHALSTLLWVKEPASAPDLPRLQVLADCYAALSPSASLWTKIGDEIERLAARDEIDPDNVHLLRYSHEAQQALMDVTYGDPKRVNEKAIKEALARAKATVARPAEAAAERARAEAERAEAAEARSRFDAEASTAENQDLRARIDLLERRESARRAAIEGQAQRQAGVIAYVAKTVGWLLLALGAAGLASVFPPAADYMPRWLDSTARIVAIVLGVLGFVTLLLGGSVFGLIDRWREKSVTKRLRRAGLE